MRGAEGVVFAFRALGESREAAALTQRFDPVAPPGQYLVRIGLMADVPDQPIIRRVEHVVQRDRQFDDAKAGTQMATRYRDSADSLVAQFIGNFLKIFFVDATKIGWRLDRIQNGCARRHA